MKIIHLQRTKPIRNNEIHVSILKKAKKKYYGNLNPSSVTDNKTFWKTVKPLFSSKMTSSQAIALCEQSHIFDNDQDIADIFNDFFINAVKEFKFKLYFLSIQFTITK